MKTLRTFTGIVALVVFFVLLVLLLVKMVNPAQAQQVPNLPGVMWDAEVQDFTLYQSIYSTFAPGNPNWMVYHSYHNSLKSIEVYYINQQTARQCLVQIRDWPSRFITNQIVIAHGDALAETYEVPYLRCEWDYDRVYVVVASGLSFRFKMSLLNLPFQMWSSGSPAWMTTKSYPVPQQ